MWRDVLPALPRRFVIALLFPVLLVLAGTIGYQLIEHWTWFESFYMTVITLTTVGYGEVHPLDHAGRVFTTVLLLGGVFTVFFAVTEVLRAIVGGELRSILGRQQMKRSLAELREHVIVCGFGRMGRFICKEFAGMHMEFVAIERNEESFGVFDLDGIKLVGDATSDAVLLTAGVERARALVAALPSDADNLYITMTARLLNPKIFVVARAENEAAQKKLVRAGANRVVSPYVIGGHRVAQAVVRPAVVDFIELAMRSEHLELQIEELRVGEGSKFTQVPLQATPLASTAGLILLAVKSGVGELKVGPALDTKLQSGDVIIVLGSQKQLEELERWCS